jgi:hypothetical protein
MVQKVAGTCMREEQRRELQVLSDAEAHPKVRTSYSFKDQPELAATARRIGMEPVPHMINIKMDSTIPNGPMIYLMGINESGRKRLKSLRLKLAVEQR